MLALLHHAASASDLAVPAHSRRLLEHATAPVGVPAGPVLSPLDALDHPHFKAREMVRWVDDAQLGQIPQILELIKRIYPDADILWTGGFLQLAFFQQGIIVIPGSGKPERQKENFDVLDFSLEPGEMNEIATLKKPDGRVVNPPQSPKWDM